RAPLRRGDQLQLLSGCGAQYMIEGNAVHPTLCEYLDLNGKWRAERTAVVFEDQRLTWGELRARINQTANGLNEHGVGVGQRVAALIDNRLETVEAMIGAMRSGAAIAPINLTISD